MSLPKTKLLSAVAVISLLGVTACGFSPVHAPGGTGHALYGQVEVTPPEKADSFNDTNSDTNAYFLVRNLEERLGRANGGAFRLDLTVSTATEGQAITADNAITRYSIIAKADYTLTRNADGAVIASGQETNFTGYSATGSTVETLAGERDAYERLMRILADQITSRLLATADVSPPLSE